MASSSHHDQEPSLGAKAQPISTPPSVDSDDTSKKRSSVIGSPIIPASTKSTGGSKGIKGDASLAKGMAALNLLAERSEKLEKEIKEEGIKKIGKW